MTLKTGLEKLADLECKGSFEKKHYVLCNRMGGEDITYDLSIQTFNDGKHDLTNEDLDKDKCDTWHIYEIIDVNGYKIRKPVED